MTDKNDTAFIAIECMDQRFAAFNIKMVCWLIQNQNMRRVNRGDSHQQARLLPTRESFDRVINNISTDASRTKTGTQLGWQFLRP